MALAFGGGKNPDSWIAIQLCSHSYRLKNIALFQTLIAPSGFQARSIIFVLE
jgi:hypothetical protein